MDATLSGVGVLDKVMGVLDALRRGPATLTELQARTGLPRATAHRFAVALEVHGLVRRDEAGRFALGPALVELGQAASRGFPLVAAARPVLESLRDQTSEGVQLYVREGDQRRCVVSLPATHALQWIVPEGVLLPLDRGSAGRVLGRQRPPDGWVESVEEREKGVASVSAAVFGPNGDVIGAISVSGPLERLTRTPGRRFGGAVVEASTRLSAALAAS